MNQKIIKTCGMTLPTQMRELENLSVDRMGLIFYAKSPRNVPKGLETDVKSLKNIKKVGVFVNEAFEVVLEKVTDYGLDFVQLHGDESPEYCDRMSEKIPVMKAFSISEDFDFRKTEPYNMCESFVFDTKGKTRGGTGQKYDWKILEKYNGAVPFFLSGGIGPLDKEAVINFTHEKYIGIDLNSGFESEPGVKQIEVLRMFLTI